MTIITFSLLLLMTTALHCGKLDQVDINSQRADAYPWINQIGPYQTVAWERIKFSNH